MCQLSLEGRALPMFFVTPGKRPFAGSHAYLDATADPAELAKLAERFRGPKLLAVATGAISGIDIVDIDPRHGGDRWYFEHIDQLGKTRVHETRGGGWHLIYKHSPSLRNSNKLAHGVEFLSTGRWAVWWAAHGCRVLCEGPVAPLPGWLHEALLTIPGDMATQKEVRPSAVGEAEDAATVLRAWLGTVEGRRTDRMSTFLITLRTKEGDDGIRTLRAALKALLRRFGLRAYGSRKNNSLILLLRRGLRSGLDQKQRWEQRDDGGRQRDREAAQLAYLRASGR